MRYTIKKKNSTGAERRVYETLKELRIPFKHRWLDGGLEIDFVIGKYALDIDGHAQDGERNHKLASLGYTPLHLSNEETYNKIKIKELLNQIYGNN